MTRHMHDIEAVFAAFGMPSFPYRTFPLAGEAQDVEAPIDRRRERQRPDVRRPERPGTRGMRPRVAEEVRAVMPPSLPLL